MNRDIERIKAMYPTGTRIMLDYMDDPYHPVESGTKGTVSHVDDAGTIHVKWDNGRGLGLVYGVDSFHKIGGDE